MQPTKDFSPDLRSAKMEIVEVLKKYDIAGAVVLADGLGMGEFGFYPHLASWSGVTQNDFGFRLKMNSRTEADTLKANKTANAIAILKDICFQQAVVSERLYSLMKANVPLDEDPNPRTLPEGNLLG